MTSHLIWCLLVLSNSSSGLIMPDFHISHTHVASPNSHFKMCGKDLIWQSCQLNFSLPIGWGSMIWLAIKTKVEGFPLRERSHLFIRLRIIATGHHLTYWDQLGQFIPNLGLKLKYISLDGHWLFNEDNCGVILWMSIFGHCLVPAVGERAHQVWCYGASIQLLVTAALQTGNWIFSKIFVGDNMLHCTIYID